MMAIASLVVSLVVVAGADQTAPPPRPPQPPPAQAAANPQAEVPSDYVIGAQDVLGVVFWREPDVSGDVTVRPDGRISIPVIGTLQAGGLRPEELQQQIAKAASKYMADPNVAVVVRTINSRKVFVTGSVRTPGAHPLVGPLSVLQAIAMCGGLSEYANAKNITVLRTEGGRIQTFKFNYKDVVNGKRLEQNIQLRPGDTVVVP